MLAVLFIAAIVMAVPMAAQAVGTASGIAIDNRATVNYQVGGVSQPLVESSPGGNTNPGAGNGSNTSFLVDNKVNPSVTADDAGIVVSYPSGTSALKFTVTNGGNTTQDFVVTALTGTHQFADTVAFYADTNSSGTFNAGDALLPTNGGGNPYINDLSATAASNTFVVFLVSTATSTAANNQINSYALSLQTYKAAGAATTPEAETRVGLADDPAAVDVVFADGDGDGAGADDANYDGKYVKWANAGFQISATSLRVTKTSAVYSDPVLGISVNAKAIPGAVVTYTVLIENLGSVAANSVAITDDLSTPITAGSIAFNAGFLGNAPVCAADEGIVVDGVCNTNALSADNGSFAANTVTVTGLSINGGSSATIKYQVIIQ
jgi:uncharacterized repeat protein (TIGR01451 family)